jgi:cysteinyl-tRNA synthetase
LNTWPKKKRHYRLDTYIGNRWNRGDFIIWHGYRPQRDGDVFWETDIGKGRPAWNIQDPAIITKHLGYTIDIACGGIDNLFRHHDYNIAVIEAVSGENFANYWLHGAHVLLNNKKIAKSAGNTIYPEDLIAKGFTAAGIRFCLISTHYRSKLNLTEKMLKEKEYQCRRLQTLARNFTGPLFENNEENPETDQHIKGLLDDFEKLVSDDLNVGAACAALLHHLEKLMPHLENKRLNVRQWDRARKNLLRIDSVLQILFE